MSIEAERDVVIIGAGAAGLAAAVRLREAGLQPLILEARTRIGGRVFSDYSGGAAVELGAEFVHGANAATWAVIDKVGLTTERWDGERRFAHKGALLANGIEAPLRERVFALYDLVTHYDGPDISVDELLRRETDSDDLAGYFVRRWFAGMEAADVTDLSARWVAQERAQTTAGWENFHVTSGYDRVIAALAEGLEIRLAAAVAQLAWDNDGATLTLDENRQVRARRVIVTVPLSLLQTGRLRFDPALPAAKQQAMQALAMGHVTKLALWFDQVCWGTFQILSSDGLVASWWQTGSSQAPALMGYTGGPAALELAALGAAGAVAQGLEEAVALFGSELRQHFRRGQLVDWASDPWSQGAYSYTPVGAGTARQQLATPLASTVFFAGEATHSQGHLATVHGALETGWRAADEVLATRD